MALSFRSEEEWNALIRAAENKLGNATQQIKVLTQLEATQDQLEKVNKAFTEADDELKFWKNSYEFEKARKHMVDSIIAEHPDWTDLQVEHELRDRIRGVHIEDGAMSSD